MKCPVCGARHKDEPNTMTRTTAGIAADVHPTTLARWERAGALSPFRDKAGYRQYTRLDVKLASLIRTAVNRGRYDRGEPR